MGKLVVTGVKEIDRRLATLEPKVAKKHLRQAMRKGMRPIQSQVEGNAPAGESGDLAASVILRAGKRSRNKMTMNVALGSRTFRGEKFYATFTEWGTSDQPAQGYMRRAFDTRGRGARDVIVELVARAVEIEAESGG
jgi:HK97 gp10 family phage protein